MSNWILRENRQFHKRQNRAGKMQSAVTRYYNINKILMSKLGCWPTQSKFMKILLPTIITSFIFSIGFLEVNSSRFLCYRCKTMCASIKTIVQIKVVCVCACIRERKRKRERV